MQNNEEDYTLSIAATILRPLNPKINIEDLRRLVEEQNGAANPDQTFTRDDLSEKTKLSLSTIDRLIKAGDIKVIRIRRSIRIPASEVERLLAGKSSEQADSSTRKQQEGGDHDA